MIYQVYRNLNNGKLSIREKSSGLVIGYADEIMMTDAKFVVQESGRQRVLKENRKNVHAFVEGNIFDVTDFVPRNNRKFESTNVWISVNMRKACYNPYKSGYFHDHETLNPIVLKSTAVHIKSDGTILYDYAIGKL